ncbi:MAG: invasion associated locus B family protein [Pseudomonadota bacterium]
MTSRMLAIVALMAALAAPLPAFAQTDESADSDAETEAPETEAPEGDAAETETPPPGGGLSTGEVVSNDPQPGETYISETHGDWEVRCIVNPQGTDPCQLYQMLTDPEGAPVAEMSLFPVNDGGPAEAGATIITPLETLLTEQVTIAIDSDPAKRYPFSFCTPVGCFARIGLTGDDLAAMRRGIEGRLRIVPAAAPDRQVVVALSLTGFTDGFNALREAAAAEE